MITIKKVVIALLLTVGFVGLMIPVSVVVDNNRKSDDMDAVFGGLAIGVPSLSIAIYLLWDDKRKREQEKSNSLRKLFFEAIESSNGKINSLQFAKKVTLSGETNLSGNEATLFLDQMVKEFRGNRDVSQKGTIYYEFDLNAIPLGDDEELSRNPSTGTPPKPISKTETVTTTIPTKNETNTNSTNSNLTDQKPPKKTSLKPNKNIIFSPLDTKLLDSLEDNLSVAEWKKADEVTAKLMLKVANQTMSLNPDDIAYFPCEALSKIDELWQIYSHNRFGFLVQAEVFNDCFSSANSNIILNSKNWQKYAQALGWYVNSQWPNHHGDLRFSLTNSPKGYLPFLPVWQGAWWGSFLDGQGERFHLLIKRVKQCQLSTHIPKPEDPPNIIEEGIQTIRDGITKEINKLLQ